jgi:hypothetical protein
VTSALPIIFWAVLGQRQRQPDVGTMCLTLKSQIYTWLSMANLNNTTEMTEIQKNWDKTERYVKQVIAVLQMLGGIILSRHYFFKSLRLCFTSFPNIFPFKNL